MDRTSNEFQMNALHSLASKCLNTRKIREAYYFVMVFLLSVHFILFFQVSLDEITFRMFIFTECMANIFFSMQKNEP